MRTGSIGSASDIDFFKINIPNNFLEVKIKKPLKEAGKYYRYYIALYDSSQTLVALRQTTANYDTEYIRCKVPASGYYYIKVYGGEGNFTNALTYTLTIK